MLPEQADHFPGLALPQQAVIDKDTGQLIANGFVQQDRHDGAIHPAR